MHGTLQLYGLCKYPAPRSRGQMLIKECSGLKHFVVVLLVSK